MTLRQSHYSCAAKLKQHRIITPPVILPQYIIISIMTVKSLVELDHHYSQKLLRLDNKLVSYLLLPFSTLFHPKLIYVPILTIFYLSHYSALDAGYYGLSMLITLIFSTLLKRRLKRDRPALRSHVGKHQHFRKKQTNFSIPSGDTIQAALFSYFLYYVYGVNWLIAAGITVLVAISRVYFMCHWIGDTVFAVIIQGPIALALIYMREPFIEVVREGLGSYGVSL